MSKTIYIASTSAGKTWGLAYYKPAGRNGAWSATEGVLEKAATPGGFDSFSFMMFQARTRRQELTGVATEKRKAEALATLVNSMREEGLIALPEVEAA
jgi:hypothetical protein